MSIRQLKSGDQIPAMILPARYRAGNGYIRLRWRIGVNEYVEVYEHRVVDGYVTTAEHVHHRNGIRHDNSPENLEYLTADEHNRYHSLRQGRRWYPYRSFSAMWKAAHGEHRRFLIAQRAREIVRLYHSGMSTVKIGQLLGLDPSGVSRYLTKGRNW